jgi:hypothetical protein
LKNKAAVLCPIATTAPDPGEYTQCQAGHCPANDVVEFHASVYRLHGKLLYQLAM